MAQKRVSVYVDGFNLYHALDDLNQDHLKWLDLWSLCEKIIAQDGSEVLDTVKYFSAYATWREKSMRRHQRYVAALRAQGVTVVMGRFKEKRNRCRSCGTKYISHEEKETDVNIALKLLEFSVTDKFDKAVIISGDSDLIPPVLKIKQLTPNKKTLCIVPKKGHDLMTTCHSGTRLKKKHLEKSLFPKIIKSNKRVIECPKEEWLPQ